MYSWEKSRREDRLRKDPKPPSFSSTLLDQIYRSIDGGDEKCGELRAPNRERIAKKHSNSNNGGFKPKSSSVGDEETVSLRRARLIEKWMEKKVGEKIPGRRRSSLPELDRKNDPLFFSSSSSSSDSSSGRFSSSETESFGAPKPVRSAAPQPKPVRTTTGCQRSENSAAVYQLSEENLIKSKTKALRIYENLKKVKQPVSPGGRISNFLNSIFSNGSAKKSKNSNSINGSYDDRKANSTQASTCSSASSFSRSCLSKTSPNSREKLRNGVKRTVRFYPVSVIVDENSRPCGHKCIYDEDSEKIWRSSSRRENKDQPKLHSLRKNYNDDDAGSDSSSDLFELDHLALFKNDRFSEELPVFETTYLGTNLAIAGALIR